MDFIKKIINSIKKLIISFIRCLPLFSGVPDLSLANIREAFYETLLTICFALSPIFFASAAKILKTEDFEPSNILNLTQEIIVLSIEWSSRGELIFISLTMLAPILWLAINADENEKKFPSNRSHIVLVLGITVVSVFIYALETSGSIKNYGVIKLVSPYVFLTTICLLWLATCYKNIPNPAKVFKEEEDDFVTSYQSHREDA